MTTARPVLSRRCWLGSLAAVAAGRALGGPSPAAGRVLRIVGPWELAGLDPARSGYLFTRLQIAETLTDSDDAGRALPGLASRWSISPDGLFWRFGLRPGARFHDGTTVEARHVAWVLERARATPGPLRSTPIKAIAEEGGEVVVRLSRPHAGLASVLAHSANQILAPAAFDRRNIVRAVIGSGPYRMTSISPPQSFEVARFEDYPLPPGGVAEASYLSISRPETRALLAESGQADLAWTLDPASLKRLRTGGRVRVLSATIPRTVILKLNAGHPYLNDTRARTAISLALDRDGIAGGLLRDPGLSATQLLPPSLADWYDPTLAPLRSDPAASRALLAALGWRQGPDGILVRGGDRFALELRTFFDRPELPLLAAAVQEQLRQVGIAIRVEIGNSSDIPLGHRMDTLQIGLTARNYGNFPDPLDTLRSDFSPQGGDWGAMHWSSPQVDAALDALQISTEPPRDASLRRQVVRTLQEELPVVPVAWYRQTVALGPAVEGVTIDPLERSYRVTAMRVR